MDKATQSRVDEITYAMYIDCYFNATEAARQLGCSRQAVKDRVRRHSLRIYQAQVAGFTRG